MKVISHISYEVLDMYNLISDKHIIELFGPYYIITSVRFPP